MTIFNLVLKQERVVWVVNLHKAKFTLAVPDSPHMVDAANYHFNGRKRYYPFTSLVFKAFLHLSYSFSSIGISVSINS